MAQCCCDGTADSAGNGGGRAGGRVVGGRTRRRCAGGGCRARSGAALRGLAGASPGAGGSSADRRPSTWSARRASAGGSAVPGQGGDDRGQAGGWNGREHTGNPWRADRSSGGSSAGAAVAAAAAVVPIATGGDSAGSLRIPAAFCGVTGLKGTYGRVPRLAGRSLAQLTVSGVIGADLADTVLATSIASGPDPRDPAALPPWPVPATAGRQLTVGF